MFKKGAVWTEEKYREGLPPLNTKKYGFWGDQRIHRDNYWFFSNGEKIRIY